MKINPIGHLVKANPIQTQSKPVLSAVEWANFRNAQMNVNLYFIEDYRKKDDFAVRKNEPNSNPISSKAKMDVNIFATKDYENKTALKLEKNKPNSKPVLSAVEWANFKRILVCFFKSVRLYTIPIRKFISLGFNFSSGYGFFGGTRYI